MLLLVVDLPYPSEKWMEWKSVGMKIPFPIFVESHSKFHGSSHHQPLIVLETPLTTYKTSIVDIDLYHGSSHHQADIHVDTRKKSEVDATDPFSCWRTGIPSWIMKHYENPIEFPVDWLDLTSISAGKNHQSTLCNMGLATELIWWLPASAGCLSSALPALFTSSQRLRQFVATAENGFVLTPSNSFCFCIAILTSMIQLCFNLTCSWWTPDFFLWNSCFMVKLFFLGGWKISMLVA